MLCIFTSFVVYVPFITSLYGVNIIGSTTRDGAIVDNDVLVFYSRNDCFVIFNYISLHKRIISRFYFFWFFL